MEITATAAEFVRIMIHDTDTRINTCNNSTHTSFQAWFSDNEAGAQGNLINCWRFLP